MNDAEKREKVIRGLKAHCEIWEMWDEGKWADCKRNPDMCPYYRRDRLGCTADLAADALALLKEHEPRVMTLQEVRESFGNPMWFESHGTYLGEKGWWCLSHGTMMPFNIVIFTPKTDGPIRLGLADYNKVWRAWNFKPSEEQMKNTPWEENNE